MPDKIRAVDRATRRRHRSESCSEGWFLASHGLEHERQRPREAMLASCAKLLHRECFPSGVDLPGLYWSDVPHRVRVSTKAVTSVQERAADQRVQDMERELASLRREVAALFNLQERVRVLEEQNRIIAERDRRSNECITAFEAQYGSLSEEPANVDKPLDSKTREWLKSVDFTTEER